MAMAMTMTLTLTMTMTMTMAMTVEFCILLSRSVGGRSRGVQTIVLLAFIRLFVEMLKR